MNSIVAIARTLFKEIIRMRMLMLFMILLLLGFTILFTMWLGLGTGRPDEKVQTFISYSMSGIVVLLSFTTMFLSVATVTRDIKRKEIFTITTKPVSRLSYLIGKLLGISFFNFIFLLAAFGLIYYSAENLASKEVAKLTSPDEKAYFRDRIDVLVLAARQGQSPLLPSFEQQIAEQVEAMLQDQISRYPELKTQPGMIEQMRNDLTADAETLMRRGFLTVPVGEYKTFEFSNLNVTPDQEFIYFRYNVDTSVNPEDLKVYGQWIFGPEDPLISQKGQGVQTHDLINTFHEFRVPAELISPEGKLFVTFRNPYENMYSSVLFSNKSGIEVLYTASSYGMNMIRAFMLIMFRLTFLAVLSLAMGALLSFPVAVMAVLVVFVIGVCSNFIFEAVDTSMGYYSGNVVSSLLALFPQLAKYDPSYLLEKGRYVDPLLVADCLLKLVFLNGGIIGGLGYFFFRKKELARVIV